jgi:hypothetical protein
MKGSTILDLRNAERGPGLMKKDHEFTFERVDIEVILTYSSGHNK